MAKIINIADRITNQLPVVQVSDDIVMTVNNRKSTILSIQLLIKEQEKKAKENNDEYDEMAFMSRCLGMLVGEKNVKAIDDMDLPLPEYKIVYETVMAVATGDYSEGGTPS